MATYIKESETRPLEQEAEPLCDPHSLFDGDGFPLPAGDGKKRAWFPVYGAPCTRCGVRC